MYNKGGLFWNLEDVFDVFSYKNSLGSVNISDNENKYTLEFNVAGMNKEDIEISAEDGVLKVIGNVEISDKETKTYHRKEFKSSSFERSFQLPEDITDEIEARVKKGILVVELPKKVLLEKQLKQVEIK